MLELPGLKTITITNKITHCKNMSDMEPRSYMFLRSNNIKHTSFLYGNGEYLPLDEPISKSSKIYDNGDSQIYNRITHSW